MSSRPLIALVGKVNQGKSTLFNRLVGRNRALVSDVPGTTRDKIYGQMEWMGDVMDIVDTGGMFQDNEDFFSGEVMEQARMAAEEAQLVVMVVDGRSPVDDKDKRIARLLQKNLTQRPVVLAINKIDSTRIEEEVRQQNHQRFLNLGLGDPFYISALHADGTLELIQHLHRILYPNSAPRDRREERERQKQLSKTKKDVVQQQQPVLPLQRDIRIAVVGCPNVGKSTLVNSIVSQAGAGEGRSMTSPIEGTTHDTVDTPLEWGEDKVVLLDTAGISRRAQTQRASLERSTVLFALKSLQSADVNVLVMDSTTGVTAHEKRIASYILDSKSSVLLVVNKSDLLVKPVAATKQEYEKLVRKELRFLPWVPIIFTSASKGANVKEVVDMACRVYHERRTRIPTRKLWDLVQRALLRRAAPSKGNVRLKIGFVTQAKTSTPTFVFFVNDPDLVHFSFERFMENAIRESYPFTGSPINMLWKKKEGNPKLAQKHT